MICDREESESTFYELISLFVLGGREDLPAPRIFLIRASLCGCQGASGREPREPDAGFSGISFDSEALILYRISLERR